MFESAELGHRVDKASWKAQVPPLREALLEAQLELLERADRAVVVLIGGVEGAGKGETVNLLNEWMDPRHIRTEAFSAMTSEERQRPFMWRYWRALPAKGRIGILFGSWYTDPILERVDERCSDSDLDVRLQRIRHFERMLVQEGVVLVKLWFHLSRAAQQTRLQELASDPDTAWRVTGQDWKHFHQYDRFRAVSEKVLQETGTDTAPWQIIDGTDHRYRSLMAAEALLTAMKRPARAPAPVLASPPPRQVSANNVIARLDYTRVLDKPDYKVELARWQRDLALLSRDRRFASRNVVCVFEGNDAAGKGGTIRRVITALDARHYRVVPIAAPSDEERAQPYLWRFWRHLPRHGRFTLFDRSWYGRVLVERVEQLCADADWQRAYDEINEFEQQLIEHGTIICKFWLAITPEEQLARFRAREDTGYKRFKITAEDWRNRERWPDYEQAVCDMVDRTSTRAAPWTLVPANDKRHARIQVLGTLCTTLENALSDGA